MTSIRCFMLLFCLAAVNALGQNSRVQIASPAKWIEDVAFDVAAAAPAGQASGFYYLLLDRQENISAGESYIHNAYRFMSNEGVQDMADLSIEFDAKYQQLVFHKLVIHRDGKTIDKMPRSIRAIQREESMDRFLYDESFTAIFNLTDVRVGDVLEYAFTRKGYNPVFKGQYASVIYLNHSNAYEKKIHRILAPGNMKLNLKGVNGAGEPVVNQVGTMTEYKWTRGQTRAVDSDQNAPSWYDPYEYFFVTSASGWQQIATWAHQLFRVSESDRKKVEAELPKIIKATTDEEYALAAIRFVQDEVRYLGFESGLNSYQPHSPWKILDQRFGDCKDKSLLLCTILQARGIEAYPVLVNTSSEDKIDEYLPAGNIFDHCVVNFRFDGRDYFIDPTINNQGGDLTSTYFPRYVRGLIVDGKTFTLSEVGTSVKSSTKEIQKFILDSINGSADFEVETIYKGWNADSQRSNFASNDLQSLEKGYLNFYADTYPGIEPAGNITYFDNRAGNVFVVREKYRIPKFWQPMEDSTAGIYCMVKAQTLSTYFDIKKSAQRKTPYALTYPLDFQHEVHVYLPEPWNITPEEKKINTDLYSYSYQISYKGNEAVMRTSYATKAGAIPVEALGRFHKDHDTMMGNLSYHFTYNPAVAAAATAGPQWPGLSALVIFMILALAGSYLLYQKYDPAADYPSAWGHSIGGWLYIPAFSVLAAPLQLAVQFLRNPEMLNGEPWVTSFAGGNYVLGGILVVEQFYNIALAVFALVMVVLFYKRRSSVPRLMLFYYGIPPAFLIIDYVTAETYGTVLERSDWFQVTGKVIAAIIWIPYFLTSQRVKRTFVNRLRGDSQDTTAEPELVTAHSDALR